MYIDTARYAKLTDREVMETADKLRDRDILCDIIGIDGFNLDECDNSDFVHDWSFPNCTQFPSGMDGEVYHTLFGTLYMQTILKALGDSLMVAPLTEGDNGKRRVYIPEGSWQDYPTGEAIECGWHDVEAKLIPVLKKLQ